MFRKYKWTICFIVLTPVLIIACFFLLGGGHGWIEPTIILFPFATIQFIRSSTIDLGFLLAGFFQYPLYGLLIDSFQKKNITKILLITLHVILILVSYQFIPKHFQ
ncbi:hypothetical protein [Cytophaga aurantiaca]|uniref:hypothetical protein n=1 Tax=Cytophaga aurantiaca TaxID=29530 RepID=UPI000379FD71|nr:hypothetical protein [Cytophaga aurantiaca]